MDRFDNVQRNLVYYAEKAHFEGFRHGGLSGTICEGLLIRKLRKDFPGLRFDRGIIKFSDYKVRGNSLLKKKGLSPQMDIIIYRGKPIYCMVSQAVVHISQVIGVIEIKKWAYPLLMKRVDKRMAILKTSFRKNSKQRIAILFVAFRYHDRGEYKNWALARKKFKTGEVYAFSGNFTRKSGEALYPREEKWWKDFSRYPYAGEYKKLTHKIAELNRN